MMPKKLHALAVAAVLAALAAFAQAAQVAQVAVAAAGKSPFVFEAVDLGALQQGVRVPVEIKGRNVSSRTVALESVFDQMVGGEDFVFPNKVLPSQEFRVRFVLNTAYFEGHFAHNIVLVDTSGAPHLAVVSGFVDNPVVFSERILDLGFYRKGKQKKWFFYAWNADGKELRLRLKPESQREFAAEFFDVRLDVRNFENIKEGGNTPGVKVVLSLIGLEQPRNAQKSIRKIVSFVCENFPSATPELLVTGYWE